MAERRGPGRPRKWASDAERAKAYRERRKEELAEPAAHRLEVRELRRQVATMTGVLGRRDSMISKLQAQVKDQQREIERLTVERDDRQSRITRLFEQLQSERAKVTAQQAVRSLAPPGAPAQRVNRAERRAAERRERKRR